MERVDAVVVGAGIVGLATAWQLLQRYPDLSVVVLDKEEAPARHQSGRNSGVLHAGIYYEPGSLKARLCRRGKGLIEEYASERGIDVSHNGKLVIATDEEELPRFARLEERARANGVQGLRTLDARELRAVEPAAAGIRALHSPTTGVIDFRQVCDALVIDVKAAGGDVRFNTEVTELSTASGDARLVTADGRELQAQAALVCAGLRSDQLVADEEAQDIRVIPFRGTWYALKGDIADSVRGNIYPVPDPRFPFLGVHVTRRIDDQVWAGPNAFLALAREKYRRGAVNMRDLRATLSFPGLWRFARRNMGAAFDELHHELLPGAYAKSVARYLPGITADDLERGPIGIRAQAMTRDGKLVEDFSFSDQGPVLHVRNTPSPAATSSFAIGELLADRITERLSDR